MASCRLCGSDDLDGPIRVAEHMFGDDVRFDYLKCGDCGCLQIAEEPADIARFYPANYYSFRVERPRPMERLKAKLRTRLAVFGPRRLFARRQWWEHGEVKAIRDAALKRSDRILDIGCGSGDLIAALADVGFREVSGVDAFVPDDVEHPNGATVRKGSTEAFDGPYDAVMMHHALEHVWDQAHAAREMFRLLAPGGKCIVRIPTVDCWAWEHYGPDWAQIDAPRHYYLHSRGSIVALLAAAGFKVERLVDDSMTYQIFGSEKIGLGLPILDADGAPHFEERLPAAVLSTAWPRTRALNAQGRGDSIAVHAIKPQRAAA